MRLVGRALAWVREVATIWLPIAITFVAVGLIALVAHAPLRYAVHYSAAKTFARTYTKALISAAPTKGGGWDIFGLDARARVALQQVTRSGRQSGETVLDTVGNSESDPYMIRQAGETVFAWVSQRSSDDQSLQLAFIAGGSRHHVTVETAGLVEHPYVLADVKSGFDIVYGWQPPNGNFDIYALRFSSSGRRLLGPVRVARASAYDFYPRAAWDGSGHLDLIYVQSCCGGNALQVVFRRFDPLFRPVGREAIVDQINSLGTQIPNQWGLEIQRTRDGSVWAAWGEDAGVVLGKWTATGRLVWTRLLSSGTPDLTAPSLALVLSRLGGYVYYAQADATGSHLMATAFDSNGLPTSTSRVSFDPGGEAANPQAGLTRGFPSVLWENADNQPEGTPIEGVSYRAAVEPTVAQRLGLGIGNSMIDLLLVAVGGLLGGALLVVANLLLVGPLVATWVPIQRFLPEFYRWPVYFLLVTTVLSAAFAIPSIANNWIFIVQPFGSPLGWIAVAGALFVGLWLSLYGLRRYEGPFRACAFVLFCFYFLATIWAAIGIQAEVSRV